MLSKASMLYTVGKCNLHMQIHVENIKHNQVIKLYYQIIGLTEVILSKDAKIHQKQCHIQGIMQQ